VGRVKTPTFIAEFPLVTTPDQEGELLIRLSAARNLYNACLGEALRILTLMKQSKAWQHCRTLKKNQGRGKAFQAVAQDFCFDSGTLEKFAKACAGDCWIHNHLGSVEVQTTADRAFKAVQQYCFGKRGRPRFKGYGRYHSVEGKSNAACILFRDREIRWLGLTLPLKLDPRDKDSWQTQALACRTKYCRVLRKTIRGQDRWYCQLVQEGLPPRKTKNRVSEGSVGLDIGPSTIAVVSDVAAKVQQFCPTVQEPWKETKVIQRKLDRSRRATNPEHYDEKGRVKPGRHRWKRSSRYRKLRAKLSETQRRLAAERKRSHGQLCNEILAQGKEIKTEKLSYRAFQKSFGKSVKVRAPGMLVSLLTRKAENAGGSVTEINTHRTRLSQYDHATGTYVKKPLSQRIHCFGDGWDEPVQRDLYSAFLAKHCSRDNLDVTQVHEAWATAEPLLRRETSRWKQSASKRDLVSVHGHGRQSRSPVEAKPKARRGQGGCSGRESVRALESCAV
jgi:putative transposase